MDNEILLRFFSSALVAKCFVVVVAYSLALKPSSEFIKYFLRPWIKQVADSNDGALAKAGAMIGYLERILILTFVLLENHTSIGLVLALKAAYRFKDTENPHKAEYMLMGTFLSLAITLGIGMVTQWALSLL